MVGFFIQRPIFASAIAIDHGARRRDLLFPAAGLAVSRHHAAQVVVSANYPGASAQVVADTVTTPLEAADQRRRGHDLHVLGELERRLLDHYHHLRGRLSARHRRGRRPEPGVAGRVLAAGDRQSGRRDDQEAESELRSHRQSRLAGPFRRSGRAVATTPICRSSIR